MEILRLSELCIRWRKDRQPLPTASLWIFLKCMLTESRSLAFTWWEEKASIHCALIAVWVQVLYISQIFRVLEMLLMETILVQLLRMVVLLKEQ